MYARLDALVELLGPAWYGALGSNFGIAALEFLARYADPNAVIRLGQGRLSRFLIARSRGAWREDHAAGLIVAAKETLDLWGPEGMNFAELAADIAHETFRVRACPVSGADRSLCLLAGTNVRAGSGVSGRSRANEFSSERQRTDREKSFEPQARSAAEADGLPCPRRGPKMSRQKAQES